MPVEISGRRPVSSWMELIKDTRSTFHDKLHQIYGDNDDLRIEAVEMCLRSLGAFADRYGTDRNVVIIRSTGRVNLLGTHIDHRGGSVNPIAVKHMWLVVEPREDDMVLAKNVESDDFPDEQFSISRCLPAGEKNRKLGHLVSRGIRKTQKQSVGELVELYPCGGFIPSAFKHKR